MFKDNWWRTVIFLALILLVNVQVRALNTEEIDYVYEKAFVDNDVLDSGDFDVIDDFLNTALDEMFLTEDFSEIVKTRSEIASRRGQKQPSQYSASFISSAARHLKSAFDEVNSSEDGHRKIHLQRNLIILVAELGSIELADFGIQMLNGQNSSIRYWAVKSITGPGIAHRLNSNSIGDEELKTRIISKLTAAAEKENHAEILELIAKFADLLNGSEADELLLKIGLLRIKAYEDWTVEYELMDAGLLNALAERILVQAGGERIATAREFAQLYSYAMQRYINGADSLSEVSGTQLASVLVDVEQSALGKLLGRPQTAIKKAVERKNYSSLQAEHDSLLGSPARAGELARAITFDYGKDAGSVAITAPKKLPAKPQPQEPEPEKTEKTD